MVCLDISNIMEDKNIFVSLISEIKLEKLKALFVTKNGKNLLKMSEAEFHWTDKAVQLKALPAAQYGAI